MKKYLIFCLFCLCIISNVFAGNYLKLILSDGNTILVPASYVDSLYADTNGEHVYLKISKSDLKDLVYYNDSSKYSIVLPQTITIASGINCHLYYENLHNDRFNISNSLVFDGVGTNEEKSWSYKPLDTDNDAVITIKNTLSNEISTRNIQVINSKNRSGKLSILTVGDSYTDIGIYEDVFMNELRTSGYDINAIGRKNADGSNNENISGGSIQNFCYNNQAVKFTVTGVTVRPRGYWPVYTDGTNCWAIYFTSVDSNGNGYMEAKLSCGSYDNKLSNGGTLTFINGTGSGQGTITFTACDYWSLNPFWNLTTNKLDFKNYITEYNFEDPDLLVVQFLLNDVNQYSTNANMNTVISNIKKFIEQFHSQYPASKVIYSLEPLGCLYWQKNGTNYDLAYYNRFNFIRKFLSEFENNENYSYLCIAPGYAWIDREEGYDLQISGNTGSNVFLNGDYSTYYPSDVIHCNTSGMTQLGDCIYSTILNALTTSIITGSGTTGTGTKKVVSASYYTPTGAQTNTSGKGVYIKRIAYSDGSTVTNKGIN